MTKCRKHKLEKSYPSSLNGTGYLLNCMNCDFEEKHISSREYTWKEVSAEITKQIKQAAKRGVNDSAFRRYVLTALGNKQAYKITGWKPRKTD